mgnify:CR=1 FL=1|jgi:hypothetical protein
MALGAIIEMSLLLLLANGAPVMVKKALGERFAAPLDGGLRLSDGQPLFGKSKTWRGVAAGVLAAVAGALLLGLDWRVGALAGIFAMLGDLFSSFVKRRALFPPSGRASGLDHVPESLLPSLACRGALGLGWGDIAVCVLLFVLADVVLSRVAYRLNLRDRPY